MIHEVTYETLPGSDYVRKDWVAIFVHPESRSRKVRDPIVMLIDDDADCDSNPDFDLCVSDYRPWVDTSQPYPIDE